MAPEKSGFRVLIAGGSVAGLTLAHCLRNSGIDFVVLESHHDIAPEVGASIGIMPNGARIFDQLGMFDDVLGSVEPLAHTTYWADTGNLIAKSGGAKELERRHGYPITFLDRQALLQILHAHLKGDQEKVLTSKRVIRVDHHSTHVVAHCKDGSSYTGDLIVGADGVHSTVRQLMWNHLESRGFSKEAEVERKTMTSEYDCVFGISDHIPELVPGHSHRTFAEGYSLLVISSKNGRIYWFFFTKLDRKYLSHEIPRFDQQNIDNHVANWLHKPVTSSVSFGDVYERSVIKTHVALEEANYKHWCKDRFVCIGDSIHKMTPNAGQGGNSAIESAASLTNHLTELLKSNPVPKTEDIDKCLRTWEAGRQRRLAKIWKSAHDLTRMEACETWKDKLISLHLLPYLSAIMIDHASAAVVGSARVESLPLPARSLHGTVPFTDEVEKKQGTSKLRRGLKCLPLLACLGAAGATMTPLGSHVRRHMMPIFAQGFWTAGNGETLDLMKSVYPVSILNRLLKPMIACFLPSISGTDSVSRVQMFSFMADLGAFYGIWLLESYRNTHGVCESLLPISVGACFQLKGVGLLAPVYYALEYLRIPLSRLISRSGQEINAKTTMSVVFGLLAGYYLPTYANFTAPTLQSRVWWNAIWQIFPVTVPILAGLASRIPQGQKPAETSQSKQSRKSRNMSAIRCTYIGLTAVSAMTWIHALRSAPAGTSITSIFWPGINPHTLHVTSFVDAIAHFLKYDQLWAMGSAFVWLGLRFHELKQNGASFSWLKASSAFLGATLALGPGSAFALGWGWKEELMNQLSL